MKAELPLNEIMRLKALHDLAVLDTPREQSFDDIAQVAMQLCDVPIAVVSLVDKERQWFKSCLGLDARETPRDVAFCAHAILIPDDVMVVEDAKEDPRFVDNGLVTGSPYIRFYAGAPLIDENGFALGTLCVIDYKPRKITEAQKNSLKALARQVIQLLRLKATNEAMQQYSSRLQLIADKVPILIGELNLQNQYVFANQKHADWFSISMDNLIGKTPFDIVSPNIASVIKPAIDTALSGKQSNTEVQLESGRVLDFNYLPRYENQKIVGVFEVATDVTERKIHLEIMRQERERLSSIIEGTNIGTWEWNIPNNSVVINERWASMLGYSIQDVSPVTVELWGSLVHPDDQEAAFASLNKHLRGETEFHDCQFRLRTKQNTWHWVQAHGKVVDRDAQGEPLTVSGMHTDINDIKKTYQRLEENENLLRSLLSNFPGAAYRCRNSPRWTMHYLSDAVYALTGYSADDFLNDNKINFEDITHPDDFERIDTIAKKAFANRQSFDVEYRIKRADGEWRYVQETGRGVYNAQGELEFVDGFIWDIQARYDSEHEKRIMTNKMSQLFESAPIGIMQVKETGQLLDSNPEFSNIIGYTRDELHNMSFMQLTPEDDWERSKGAVTELLKNGRFGPFEKNYISKDGELIPVEISGSLINLNEGSELSWWTLVKDIRQQKRMERMKNEFISTVSHELRTPLTSISGALGLITSNMLGTLPEKAHAMLDIAYKNSQRLSMLINDLLDMEKLLAGKMYFEFKVQTLTPLIQQAVTENKSYADKYGVSFMVEDNAQGCTANIDGFRFQQVLNNFLSNAAKYSPQGGNVEIHVAMQNNYVRISVRDFGPGIPEEFKARIFQKFSQADSSDTRQKGGTGLGLAISKELVERMGGHIGFDSQLGKGTCFYAEFPHVPQ